SQQVCSIAAIWRRCPGRQRPVVSLRSPPNTLLEASSTSLLSSATSTHSIVIMPDPCCDGDCKCGKSECCADGKSCTDSDACQCAADDSKKEHCGDTCDCKEKGGACKCDGKCSC
ncbi:hypothetical protein OTU49_009384, partial [Cherax quadricarinatus]